MHVVKCCIMHVILQSPVDHRVMKYLVNKVSPSGLNSIILSCDSFSDSSCKSMAFHTTLIVSCGTVSILLVMAIHKLWVWSSARLELLHVYINSLALHWTDTIDQTWKLSQRHRCSFWHAVWLCWWSVKLVPVLGSAMKKWKSENLAFNCSYKQHYVSNKQLRIQISEITARCSAIASRKSKLSWPLTSGLNKTYFQQLAGSWQFAFCLHVLSTVPAVLATAQIGKLTFTSKCFRTRNEW